LGETRRVTLYLPAGYDRLTSRRYPVIYLSDGQNLFDESAFFGGWQVDRAVEETSGSGRARQVIVVGVDNTPDRIRDYTPTPDPHYGGGGADRYLDFIEHELKPWIDTALRTEAGPDETCIGGSSLGGLLALHAGLTRPWVFGRVLSMSPSLWWDAEELLERIRGAQGVPGIAIYLDSGGPQDGLVRTALLRDLLFGHGLRYGVDLWHWVELSHGHNEAAWRARLPRALGLVFPAR
jgi:predicted alpha/beta superfamily hydrolase